MSRFPLVLNRPTGGIEVGFDSAVLVFLACYQDPASALVIWCFGQTLSQITRTKRPDIRVFNVGLGFLSGFVAVSVMLSISPLREPYVKQLLAVGSAAPPTSSSTSSSRPSPWPSRTAPRSSPSCGRATS